MKNVENIPKKMILVRNQLLHSQSAQVSDILYLDSHWHEIQDMMNSDSAAEFILKHEICGGTRHFQPIDYIAMLNGMLLQFNGQFMFNNDVVVSLIDDYDQLNDIFKNAKVIKSFLLFRNNAADKFNKFMFNKVIVHLIKKFPSIQNMNFMFHKVKGAKVPYFTEFHLRKYA